MILNNNQNIEGVVSEWELLIKYAFPKIDVQDILDQDVMPPIEQIITTDFMLTLTLCDERGLLTLRTPRNIT